MIDLDTQAIADRVLAVLAADYADALLNGKPHPLLPPPPDDIYLAAWPGLADRLLPRERKVILVDNAGDSDLVWWIGKPEPQGVSLDLAPILTAVDPAAARAATRRDRSMARARDGWRALQSKRGRRRG